MGFAEMLLPGRDDDFREEQIVVAIEGLEKALQMARDKKPYCAIESQIGLSLNTLREALDQ